MSEESRPRRSYDLSQQEIREAFNSEALARIHMREEIDEMKPQVQAAYHAIFGTEGQGGVLREIKEIREERRESRRDKREDWVLIVLALGVVGNLVATFVPH